MLIFEIFMKNWSTRCTFLTLTKIEIFSKKNKILHNPWKICLISKFWFPNYFQNLFPNLISKILFGNMQFLFPKITAKCWLMQSAFQVFHQFSSNFISASFWANFTFESAKHIYISRTFHFWALNFHHIHLPVYGVPSFRCTGYLCVIL